MHEKKGFTKRAEEFLNGKGFYIVLFVCVAVIGVSAWLLLFSEYSPLNLGDDEGDYLDVMADADGTGQVSNPMDLRDDEDLDLGGDDSQPQSGTDSEGDSPAGSNGDLASENSNDPQVDSSSPGEQAAPQETGSDTEQSTEEEQEPTAEDLEFIWPVIGEVSVSHSPDALIYDNTMGDWRTHDGLDISAPLGTKVSAISDGTVTDITEDDMMGTTVTIDHGAGVVSVYSNLASVPTVAVGDSVTMGSVIGSVGSTALAESGETAHLHISMRVNGESADPADYLP